MNGSDRRQRVASITFLGREEQLHMTHAWGAAIGAYVIAMRAAGRSQGTIRLHRHYLTTAACRLPSPWTVTTAQLQQVLAVSHWSPETRKSARGSLRSFYRWAARAGHVERDPAADLDPVRVPPGVPRPTPESVLAQALVSCTSPRTRLMLELAAFAGLRAAEIAAVHRDDMAADGSLYVTGKGGRTRRVPLLEQLAVQLRQLDGWAFPSQWSRTGHLTPGHVTRLVSAALPDGWTAHTLRHRMGTRAYAGTRDLLAVQQLLGHSRPETTQRYVQLPDDALNAAVAAAGHVGGGRPPLRPMVA